MKKLYIMRGLPGSGKTTWVRENEPEAVVCSADHFFINEDGEYIFNPALLTAAHTACFAKAMRAMSGDSPCVVIDNTNMERAEYTPYVMLGHSLGYDIRLVELMGVTPQECAERNTHGVPLSSIASMLGRWEGSYPFDPNTIRV